MTNLITFNNLKSFLDSVITKNRLTEDEIASINSIWQACDTQNEKEEPIDKGDGALNKTELANFLFKLHSSSKNLYNNIMRFFIKTRDLRELEYYSTEIEGKSINFDENGRIYSIDETIYKSNEKTGELINSHNTKTGEFVKFRKDGKIDFIEDHENNKIHYYNSNGEKTHSNNNYIDTHTDGKKLRAKTISDNILYLYENKYHKNHTEYLKNMFDNINKKNILKVIKENSRTDYSNNLFTKFEYLYKGDDKEKILKEKQKILLEQAENAGVYTKDFENNFKSLLTEKDFKTLASSMDRLCDRILMTLDKPEENVILENKKADIEANGKIDDNFSQGYTNDCWLLSAIYTAKRDDKLSKVLDEMINLKFEKDGKTVKEVIVTIQDKDYIISQEELKGAIECISGDLDVRAIEIAVNRYLLENNKKGIDSIKDVDEGFSLLFGTNYNIEKKKIDFLNSYESIKDQINSDKTLGVIGATIASGYYAYDDNGEKIAISPNHGYSIIKTDDDFIFIVNPWDTSTILRVEHEVAQKVFGGYAFISSKE